MRELLRQLWSRAECEEPVFSAEDVKWSTPGQFELRCQLGFLKETSRATWARCEACGDGHVEEVVWIRNATTGNPVPFVSCPETGAARVSLDRLRRWAIDLDAIAQVLRRELGLIGNDSVLVPGRVWFLGRRHVAGRFRDFFFVVGAAREDAHTLWDRCRQIEDAPSPVILVPSQRPLGPKVPAFLLADLAAITGDRIVIDLDYLADALPRNGNSAPAKTVASFPVPAHAEWSELRLSIREHALVAQLRSITREFSFSDLGMRGPEDRRWRFLCLLAAKSGQTPALPHNSPENKATNLRKQISDLRHRLREVFPIDGDPIQTMHGARGYRCMFQISLDRRDCFPLELERWDECHFAELRDGRIAISVGVKEVFVTRAMSGDTTHRAALEAAERFRVRTEEYDLRALGLADQVGHPTAEGRILQKFLRNGGKVMRLGDDENVLRLARRLRDWMGMKEEPFRFSEGRKLWSSHFECSSSTEREPSGIG